jgi:tRNA(Glu) U13 pseudouridine synthase TruD
MSQKPSSGAAAEEKAYVAPPPEEGGPAVTTRAQEHGAPALKPGALDTDKYYAEKDMGFGDVGVRQEKDEGAKDTEKADPTFEPSGAEVEAATKEAAEGEREVLKEAGGKGAVRREEKEERGAAEGQEEKEEVGGAAQD